MTDEPTIRDLLKNISRQIDVLTMVMLDIRLSLTGLPDETVAISEPLPNRPQEQPLGEPQIMVNGDMRVVRQPLPGKHWLIAHVNNVTEQTVSIEVETPSGDRYPVSLQQLQQMYPNLVVVPNDPPEGGPHPTDRSLNPDVEVVHG